MNGVERIRNWIGKLASGGTHPQYQHLLDHGEAFTAIAPAFPQLRHFKKENKTVGIGCYATSQRFALAYPGVKYYEGYRYGGNLVVVDFAWCVVGGRVVEWTKGKVIDTEPPTYYGVEIPVTFLYRFLCKGVLWVSDDQEGDVIAPMKLRFGMPLLHCWLKSHEKNEQ